MQHYLIGPHFLGVLMFVAPIVATIVLAVRWARGTGLPHDRFFKLLLDLVTFIPVGVMLWNIFVYNASYTFIARLVGGDHNDPSQTASVSKIAFSDAVAGSGESTIVLAVIVVFVRVAWDIGKNICD